MKRGHSIPIGIVGDFDAARPTHVATEAAVAHAAGALGVEVQPVWLATDGLLDAPLQDYAGFLVAPGSPYRCVDGALRAIAYARACAKPLLGTCGGFQHVVLEFARNVLGRRPAQSAEVEPHAPDLVVEALACSLAGERAGLAVSGVGAEREPRIVELAGHPFFVAKLFLPQLSSSEQRPHPLLTAFVAAMR